MFRKSSHKNTYGEGSSASIRGGKERRGYAADSSDDSGIDTYTLNLLYLIRKYVKDIVLSHIF